MTTVTFAVDRPGGGPRAYGTILVALVAGPTGGSTAGGVVVDSYKVRLDADGEGSIELVPNDEITPSGSFYRFTVADSSPTIVRPVRILAATADPVAWDDETIQVVEAPVGALYVPSPESQPDGRVLVTEGGQLAYGESSGPGGPVTAADVSIPSGSLPYIESVTGSPVTDQQSADETIDLLLGQATTAFTGFQTQLNAKADTADLATVATSGAYADLSGKPTIPTTAADVGADAAGAAAAAQAYAIQRANHTGTQAQATVTGLVTDLAGKVPLSTATTKGDLFIATAAGTVTRKAAGSDGTVLLADSTDASGRSDGRFDGPLSKSGRYSTISHATRTTSSTPVDRMDLIPVRFNRTTTIDQLAIETTSSVASATNRLGIYGSSATEDPAGAPLFDSGDFATVTAAVFTTAVSFTFRAGVLYYLARVGHGVASALRSTASSTLHVPSTTAGGTGPACGYLTFGVTGALPTNPSLAFTAGTVALVWWREV